MAYGIYLLLEQTGLATSSILLSDIHEGLDFPLRRRPGPVYVPATGTIALPYSGSVALSYESGAIRSLIMSGHITAEMRVAASPIFDTGIDRASYYELYEDFVGYTTATLPAWLKSTKTGTSTNNVVAYVSAANGIYRLLHSSDSEAQTMRLDGGDSLSINISKNPVVEFRVKVNIAGATMSADQRWVIGLCSAYNSTLDSTTVNAWFRGEGANLNVLAETDDNATNTDDIDTGSDWADNTYAIYKIDLSDLSSVKFYINGTRVATSQTFDMSGVTADTLLQPIVAIQRDAGTEVEAVDIDYIKVVQERT